MSSDRQRQQKDPENPDERKKDIPNKLGNIVQISQEYGALHIDAPVSPSSPRGNASSTAPKSRKPWNSQEKTMAIKSLSSSEERSPPTPNAENTETQALSPISKAFRAMKEGATRFFACGASGRSDTH